MKNHSLLFGYRVRVLFAVRLLFCVAGFSVHKATQAGAAAENSGTVASRVEQLSQSDARLAADVDLAASFSDDTAILTRLERAAPPDEFCDSSRRDIRN